jgi:hypothetical protein
MRIQINAQEREIALFALELADKECDATRKGLERLRLEPMSLMALQGDVGDLRRALKDAKRHVYDWSFEDRRAIATALHVYREQLGKLSAREGKLLVDVTTTDEKIGDVKDFIARLAGQDTFWDEPVADEEQAQPVVERADAKQQELPSALPRILVEQLDISMRRRRAATWSSALSASPVSSSAVRRRASLRRAFGFLARFALRLCARRCPGI